MEELGNFKVILYIALAILYFIFTGKKKSQPKKAEASKEQNKENKTSSGYSPSPKPIEASRPKPLLQNPSKSITTIPETGKEKAPYTLGDILTQFGNAKVENKKAEGSTVSNSKESLEVTDIKPVDYDEELNDEEVSVKEGGAEERLNFQMDEHFVSNRGANKYADILKDPEGAKAAFISGEIFNRKY